MSDDWEANCVKCKEPFVAGFDPTPEEARALDPLPASTCERPNGQALVFYGGVALGLGLLGLAIGWFLPAAAESFADIDPDRLRLKANLMAVGAVLTNLGALGFLAGKIIEAISFLPGRDDQ
ncbi:MAG: hypothetical protein H6918_03240 [Sphingomonadaceae bacterium]|nr:hypothetical protein [Sphingomonadaceae bacterium]